VPSASILSAVPTARIQCWLSVHCAECRARAKPTVEKGSHERAEPYAFGISPSDLEISSYIQTRRNLLMYL
jgi:hypothetical protein